MLRRILVFAAVALFGAGVVSIALGTPPIGAIGSPPVRGTTDEAFKFKNHLLELSTKGPIDVVQQSLTLQPGGHSGWHAHAGPVLVVVKSGTVTGYDWADPTCTPETYTAGEAVIDTGDGHDARNEGDVAAEVSFTLLLPPGAPLRTELPDPGTCPFQD
jgi:quercetin dioxygenase-like cupin family protein